MFSRIPDTATVLGLVAALAASGLEAASTDPFANRLTSTPIEIGVDSGFDLTGPVDMDAISEMVYTTYSTGDFPRVIALATPFLEKYPEESPAGLYVFAGSSYGLLGDWERAEALLQRGVGVWPDDAALRFNLGVSLAEQGRHAEALGIFEGCLRQAPYEASTWHAMAAVLDRAGMRARAFVTYARALSLEPNARNSTHIASRMWELLFEGIDRRAGEDGVTLRIGIRMPHGSAELEENSRTAEALGLALVGALRYEESWKGLSDASFFAFALDQVLMFLADLEEKEAADPFWRLFVFSFFDEVRSAGHMEALAYDIRRATGDPDVAAWQRDHGTAVARYRDWSERWAVDWSAVGP